MLNDKIVDFHFEGVEDAIIFHDAQGQLIVARSQRLHGVVHRCFGMTGHCQQFISQPGQFGLNMSFHASEIQTIQGPAGCHTNSNSIPATHALADRLVDAWLYLRRWRLSSARMGDVTQALEAMRDGDARSGDELLSLVYAELRRIAGAKMSGEAAGHTLQPTARSTRHG